MRFLMGISDYLHKILAYFNFANLVIKIIKCKFTGEKLEFAIM